jgi:hypothetical protein
MRAPDCAAIQRQKLASVRQQDSSRDAMNRSDENEISVYRCDFRKHHAQYVSPLLDGRSGRTVRELISVSVAAAECMVADALTKVVFALREEAAGLLARYRADALLLERDGAPSWMFHSPCDTRDRTRFD